MDLELSRLAAWSRSRRTAVSKFRRERRKPAGDEGGYEEADFPWKLEFHRRRRRRRRRAPAGARDEGSTLERCRRSHPPTQGASVTFSVFREKGWARGGGQTFLVRVEEEHEAEERVIRSGQGEGETERDYLRMEPIARMPALAK